MKPNFFLPTDEESHVQPSTKLPVRNKSKETAGLKSPARNEEEKLMHQIHVYKESNNVSRKGALEPNDQKSRTVNIAQVARANPTKLLEPLEKSSKADIDFEEPEQNLSTSTNESPIVVSADDVPRSAASASIKSLSLKCNCHLRNNLKYTSTVPKSRYTETDYDSSSEIESTRRLFEKSAGDSEFTDMSSEDTDLLSDYVDYNHVKTNGKDKEMFRHTCRAVKPSSLTNNSARMRTTSFSFFNVFLDIVFWPIIFFRAKQ
ncbi:uncharacterized protein LOC112590551 [Harpegnathos saltator]|uniref:uncharacterized protein LOC112590551 n=1 Tax=Harpegnathos saltator TaxID=610380 RepID=UPI000DBED358|nr:uncharacterized protein LOC112590551 [Harpegnathos saltator]